METSFRNDFMTKIDLKKTELRVFLILGLLIAFFTVGAWDRIAEISLFGLPFYAVYGIVVLLIAGAVLIWFVRMRRCERAGKMTLGLKIFHTIHKYRFLLEQLVTRDFKIKYKRSVLGVFWSFLNPLLMMVVQYVVFSHLLNIRGDIEHYAIYLLSGIVIWNGFNDCANQSMRSITGNAHLITKVYVPKYIYPISKVLSATINVVLSMVPLLLVTLIYGLFATP
ncbi:MAG: ABC transporter permease, partial [Lachnospiraceae bacterium]|nr:ABC transporter permease [Lachnospiraceae bacterium]